MLADVFLQDQLSDVIFILRDENNIKEKVRRNGSEHDEAEAARSCWDAPPGL